MKVEKQVNENPSFLTGFLSGAACGAISLSVTYTVDKFVEVLKTTSRPYRGPSMTRRLTQYSPLGAKFAIIATSIAAVNTFRSLRK